VKKNIFLLIFLAITFASCGGSKSTSINTSSNTDELQSFTDHDELKVALDGQTVVCGEPGLSCPGFSAKLAFWGVSENKDSYYLATCSGSLYKGKYIITNSHCIPHEISKAGASCANQIKALFPKTKSFNGEKVNCKRIVQVYTPSKDGPDLAVIELDHVIARDSVEIEKNNFIENSNTTAFTMNPDVDNIYSGTITKKYCNLSTDNSFFMSVDTSAPQALISGDACEVIHGNSGTALLDQNGKMIGAINATLQKVEMEKLFENNKINFHSKVPMGIVQNITCLNDIISNQGSSCNYSPPQYEDFNDFISRSVQKQNLNAISEGQIEYELTAGFKLKLHEVGKAQSPNDLQSFRDHWSKIFFNKGNSSEAQKIIGRIIRK
jgi:hypothetical protein